MELAVKCFDAQSKFGASNVVGFANVFEQYLIGDVELPETQSDTGLVKAFLEVMNSEFEKKRKQTDTDYAELLKAIQTGNAGISAEVPCKSEAE